MRSINTWLIGPTSPHHKWHLGRFSHFGRLTLTTHRLGTKLILEEPLFWRYPSFLKHKCKTGSLRSKEQLDRSSCFDRTPNYDRHRPIPH